MVVALDVAPVARSGIAANELLARVPERRLSNNLRADELERWLLDANLARHEDGLLGPTPRGRELGGSLRLLH